MPQDHSDDAKCKAKEYENTLIHQRLTWLGTFEGLLFVANHYGDHPYLLPLAGFLIAVSIDIGITASNRRLTRLGAQAYSNRWNHLMPGTAIPKIIAGAWIVLLLEDFKWLLSCLHHMS